MRRNTFLQDRKAPAFHIQALEATDHQDVFQQGTSLQLSHFEFIWISRGIGALIVDFQEYMLSANAIYCLSPGQRRTVRSMEGLEGYYVSLSAEFYFTVKGGVDNLYLLERFTGGRNILLLTPEKEMLSELTDLIHLVRKEYDRNLLSRLDVLTGFLKIFMLYLSKVLPVGSCLRKLDDKTEKVMEFLTLVKRDFMTKKMVAEYASELALTPGHLNYIVKKISGFSARYHIQQCVILEAKRQIVTEKATMKELAYSLGFNDCAHFSKYFKNGCGVNFSRFRNDFFKMHQYESGGPMK
jgi:AraC family transcriptional regulator, transcriptional activator of pobA